MNDTQETAPINIRRAHPTDLVALLEMVRQLAAFHGTKPTLTLEELKLNLFDSQPWLMALVAEQDDELVGNAILAPRVILQAGKRGFHLNHLFVKPALRRQGVGRALLDATEQAAVSNGCSFITVGVAERNTSAQELYLKSGYLAQQKHGRDFRKILPVRPVGG